MGHMRPEGKLLGGQPSMAGGRLIQQQRGQISDGPFVESKEAVGGDLFLKAGSFDEGAETTKSFPLLQQGVQIQIRELATICPISQHLLQKDLQAV